MQDIIHIETTNSLMDSIQGVTVSQLSVAVIHLFFVTHKQGMNKGKTRIVDKAGTHVYLKT